MSVRAHMWVVYWGACLDVYMNDETGPKNDLEGSVKMALCQL